MKKETAWAIGIGIIFGLIIAFGLWRINSSIKKESKSPLPIATNNSKTLDPTMNTNDSKLVIQSPLNNQVLINNLTTISGISKPNLKIIISTNTNDYFLVSDPEGKFEKEIELSDGVNFIEAISVAEPKESSRILAVYSSTFKSEGATSYLGTVTDVAETSIQLKSTTNEIKQIAISEDTTVSNIRESIAKIAKITDVAIGDFIIGLGQASGSSVLSTSRILISKPTNEIKTNTVSTKFDKPALKTDKNTIYYEVKDGEVSKIKSTAVKSGIDVIYTEIDDVVRTVFVFPLEVE